jgi:hypothetical protein
MLSRQSVTASCSLDGEEAARSCDDWSQDKLKYDCPAHRFGVRVVKYGDGCRNCCNFIFLVFVL